ncbi:DUF4386 domain-containing protein [Maritimibacter dapengensis]|uniref:DUF4386 domain-containing protein n=1 Tax=Maritimibacter dapengensis TaxID=2836868 RepID=A0ABS6T3F0_9RHOB|nr:DUF4386 domain-containing protein [Maritimibacter dapengensis]MBV7379783.1 DUF4386 domain-containing protein [Maritimibacter dapengensis]
MSVFNDPTQRSFSRLTGAGYTAIAIFGAFAIGYVPSQIITDDPTTTLAAINDKRGLFNAGIGADGMVMMIEVMVSTMLYQMFRRVNETLAFAAMLARFGMVTVMAAMLMFQAGLSGMASGTIPADSALTELLLHMHHSGVWVWQIFFGLHLLLLGQLVCRTEALPKIFAYGLTIGAFGYFADSLYAFAFPNADLLGWVRVGLLVIVTLSEVGFALWLLIRAPRIGATTPTV